jgi:hypothetical protein
MSKAMQFCNSVTSCSSPFLALVKSPVSVYLLKYLLKSLRTSMNLSLLLDSILKFIAQVSCREKPKSPKLIPLVYAKLFTSQPWLLLNPILSFTRSFNALSKQASVNATSCVRLCVNSFTSPLALSNLTNALTLTISTNAGFNTA